MPKGEPFCFKKAQRLKKADFSLVFEQSRSFRGRGFTILVRPNQLSYSRLGLVVSKKSIKRATGRNHVKRLVREYFRTTQHQFAPIDIVVITRRGELDDESKITQQLSEPWRKLIKYYNACAVH